MDGTALNKKYKLTERVEALEEGGGGGGYVLPIASAETLGGVKVGAGLSINSETGALSNNNPTPYSLPIAGAETLGGVKIGAGLSINSETGVLSAQANNDFSTTPVKVGTWMGKDLYRVILPFSLPSEVGIEVEGVISNSSTWDLAVLELGYFINTGVGNEQIIPINCHANPNGFTWVSPVKYSDQYKLLTYVTEAGWVSKTGYVSILFTEKTVTRKRSK